MRATLQRAGGWGTLRFRERAAEGGQRPSSGYENDFQQKGPECDRRAFRFRRTREFWSGRYHHGSHRAFFHRDGSQRIYGADCYPGLDNDQLEQRPKSANSS
jgi:hypothetical protein